MTNSLNIGKKSRGSALIAILWIIAILSLTVFSASSFLLSELESDSNSSALLQAELLADRGIAIASHPGVERGDPLLIQEVDSVSSYAARISSEGSRLPLNALLARPEQDRIVLEELFYQWGLRSDEATEVVDCLIDWIDEDDDNTNEGAERSFYLSRERRNQPYNRPFRFLDEVELVKGFEKVVAANPDWRSSFTLLSSGKLDLTEAPADLIAATCQCNLEAARLFVVSRDGYDEIPGTEDDPELESLEVALAALNPPTEFLPLILERVTIEEPVKRLISVGRYGGIAVERSATVQYNGERGNILRWTTRRIP